MTERMTDLTRVLVAELRKRNFDPIDMAYLHAKVNLLFTPEPTLTEVREALNFAETAGLVAGRANALNVMKYAITERGRFAEL